MMSNDATTNLTSFQTKCEESLNILLASYGEEVADRDVVSGDNGHILLRLGLGVEIYIYDDEVEFSETGRRRNYEAAVFSNDSDQIDTFISDIERTIAKLRSR